MKLSTSFIKFLSVPFLFIINTPTCTSDDEKYILIDNVDHGSFEDSTTYCWRVGEEDEEGEDIKKGDFIRLAMCNSTDERQIFTVDWSGHPSDNAWVRFFKISPFLDEDLVIGVTELADRKRLRVQEAKDDFYDPRQWFFEDTLGALGMGTDPICHKSIYESPVGHLYKDCLLVTNHGVKIDVGDIVHLRTYGEILEIEEGPNHEHIIHWICEHDHKC